jgi:hypothetical protein
VNEYFTEPENNVYVPATEEQIRAAKQLDFKNRLKGEPWNCPHTVFWDEPTPVYTERMCLACKSVIELI